MAFGVSAKGASEVVKAVRSAYKKTLIVKLSPNVTDITEIARAAEESGADSVSLINTLLGMAIDAERKRPIFVNYNRRNVGSSRKTYRITYGMASCQGGKYSCHWIGRYYGLERCC